MPPPRFNPATRFLETERGFISGDPTHVLLAFALGAGMVAAALLWARGGSAQRRARRLT